MITTQKKAPPAPAVTQRTMPRDPLADALDRLLAEAIDRAEDPAVEGWLWKLLESGTRAAGG
jgi:hypothetical protein